jgi:hypothetical protein
MAESDDRKKQGRLNDDTYYPETLPARTLLSLYEVLVATLEKAVEAKDTHAVSCVENAAQVLYNRVDSASLLRKVAYPSGTLRRVFSDARIRDAQEAHGAVLAALDRSNVRYGVVAEMPSIKPN